MNNKNTEEEIDDLLEDIYDESQEDEEIVEENLRDARKFLSLMEEFNIKKGSNMEANLQKNKKEIIESKLELAKNMEKEGIENINISIVEDEELVEDFILVRETLREDIKNTRIVLSKLSEDFGSISAEDINGQALMAFSDMKKSNVKSMELLMDTYEKVAKTQLSVKKLTQELKTEENRQTQLSGSEGGTNINNAVFVGSPAQLLESLKNS